VRFINVEVAAFTNFLETCAAIRKPSVVFCVRRCFSASKQTHANEQKIPCVVGGKVLEEDTNALAVVNVLVVVDVVPSATSAVGGGII
jgi:hypothetical protein